MKILTVGIAVAFMMPCPLWAQDVAVTALTSVSHQAGDTVFGDWTNLEQASPVRAEAFASLAPLNEIARSEPGVAVSRLHNGLRFGDDLPQALLAQPAPRARRQNWAARHPALLGWFVGSAAGFSWGVLADSVQQERSVQLGLFWAGIYGGLGAGVGGLIDACCIEN